MYAAGERVRINGIAHKGGKQYNGRVGTVIEAKQRTKNIRGYEELWHDIRVLLDGADESRWFHEREIEPVLWDDDAARHADKIVKAGTELGLTFDIWPSGTMVFTIPGVKTYLVNHQGHPPTIADMLFAEEYVLIREGHDPDAKPNGVDQ